nr:cytochrome P450 71A2-like [Tanacetum cinerariifolium]
MMKERFARLLLGEDMFGGNKGEKGNIDVAIRYYLVAIETMYMHAPLPLLISRESTRYVKLMGYDIATGTQDEEVEESSDSDSESGDVEDEGHAAGVKGPGIDDESYGLDGESHDVDDESHGLDDESYGIDGEGHGIESDGLGLEEEEAVPEGQQRIVLVVGTTVSEPLGLGYGALRRRELALEEDHVYSTFEVGQGSSSTPEPERSERVSALRHPTLTTWTDPKDGMVYIDVLVYPPPAPPVQTPPLPEWTSSSLPISPSPYVVPSLVSSPMISLTVPSPIASPMATSAATISVDEDRFIE